MYTNATTPPGVRTYIQESGKSVAELAVELGVSQTTIRRWLGPNAVSNGSHTLNHSPNSLSAVEEHLVCELRNRIGLPIDDIAAVMRLFVNARLSRSAIYRCLKRNGLARRPTPDTPPLDASEQTGIGVIRIELIELPVLQHRKSYAFVAVDGATRDLYLEICPKGDGAAAAGFLKRFLAHCPDPVQIVLTDNGSAFTNGLAAGMKERRDDLPSGRHPFDRLCAEHGIQHRVSPTSGPRANGLMERINRLDGNIVSHQPKPDTANGLSALHDDGDAFLDSSGYRSPPQTDSNRAEPAVPERERLGSSVVERRDAGNRPTASMGGLPRYAVVLCLLGAAVYGVSTQAFLRANDLFARLDGAGEAPAKRPPAAIASLSPPADAKAGRKEATTDALGAGAADLDATPTAATSATGPSTPAPAAAAEAGGEWIEVSGSGVNMRAGPSSSTQVLTVQPLGAKLRVLSRDGGWVETIDPGSGQRGWLYGRFAKPIEPPARGEATSHGELVRSDG